MPNKLTLEELYKLHREDVDSQHARIHSLIQDLGVRAEVPERSETERAFHSLIQYLKLHFADEEQFMATCAYPDLLAHEAKHKGLINDIDEANRRFLKGEVDIQGILPKVRASLQNHTVYGDKAYIDYRPSPSFARWEAVQINTSIYPALQLL